MERCDCWRSYEAQDGFISFARGSTRWLSSAGRGCVVSYAMAIASVRETDRGSIGASLKKLCGDGLMKSGSDMSQSHWLRVVECQGRNRAGASRSVRDASVLAVRSTYLHGSGSTALARQAGIRSVRQYIDVVLLREWPPNPHPAKEKWGRRWSGSPTVASAVYEGTMVHWTRSRRQAQLAHARSDCQVSTVVRVEWKMKSRDGLNTH